MMNKKGTEKTMWGALITLILIAVLVVLAISWISWMGRAGIWDFLKNQPDFNETDEGRRIIIEQSSVPEVERKAGLARYPIVRLHYVGGWNDVFAYRWNPSIEGGRVQVRMRIVWRNWLVSSDKEVSEEWLVNPDISDSFREQKGLYGYQKEDTLKILRAKSEEEMIEKIAEASQRKDVMVEFPASDQEAVSLTALSSSEIESFEKLNKIQIKEKLKEVNPWHNWEKNE